MPNTSYWADDFVTKKKDINAAIGMIRPGHRVFIGSYCGEPQALVKGLADASRRLTDVDIIRLMSREITPLTRIADETRDRSMNIRSIYLGSASSPALAKNKRFYTPVNMAEIPALFSSRRIPLDVALIQVSPPDDFGWMSLGVSVDITLSAALAADVVICQVNERMPMVLGESFIHINDVDAIVEHDEDIMTISASAGATSEQAMGIGRNIARLIEDGSTLQIGLDAASQATSHALSNKKDLGIHSQFLTDDIMHLYAKGVVNNHKKGYKNGKIVASCSVGSAALYEFLHLNPAVEFMSSGHVNDIDVIARHNKMVSMNVAVAVDLAGQVSCEAQENTNFAGVSGISDFVRGANRSAGGKSIIMVYATTDDGSQSRIVPFMNNTVITIPREDIRYVVTEFGAVNLFGKSTQERALALISIAHPDFRDGLLESAKEMGMVGKERSLGESVYGVYPVKLEEILTIREQRVTFRPAKPVDERRIQEHLYHLDKKDVVSRFFNEKTHFLRNDVEVMSQIDYKRNLTLIALVGETGFDTVVGIGSYYLEPSTNMAEVAFSVSRGYQGMGLGRILLRKLAEAARNNGIKGLFAVTSPGNTKMIRLFKTLPYKTHSEMDEDILLRCQFEESI